jgi:hypothetical protein
MLNTSRVLTKTASNPPKNQAGTPNPRSLNGKKSAAGTANPKTMTLVIFEPDVEYCYDEESHVQEVFEIPVVQFIRLQLRAQESGRPLAELLRAGLIQAATAPAPAPSKATVENYESDFLTPADRLEAAQVQSAALHRLLADSLSMVRDSFYSDDTNWGITELIQQTNARLQRAINLATAAPARSEEVAA